MQTLFGTVVQDASQTAVAWPPPCKFAAETPVRRGTLAHSGRITGYPDDAMPASPPPLTLYHPFYERPTIRLEPANLACVEPEQATQL